MAEINFSNAVLTPWKDSGLRSAIGIAYLDLRVGIIVNSSGTVITSTFNSTALKESASEIIIAIRGTMTASGNEFYIAYSAAGTPKVWRISNISFQSGDTFYLQIKATIDSD